MTTLPAELNASTWTSDKPLDYLNSQLDLLNAKIIAWQSMPANFLLANKNNTKSLYHSKQLLESLISEKLRKSNDLQSRV